MELNRINYQPVSLDKRRKLVDLLLQEFHCGEDISHLGVQQALQR
jgi:hypothetical protein